MSPGSHLLLFNDERYQRCNLQGDQRPFRFDYHAARRLVGTLSGVVDGDLLDCGHSAPFGGIDWVRQREPVSVASELLQAAAARARDEGLRSIRIRARPVYYGENEVAVEFALRRLGAAVETSEISLGIPTRRYRHPDDYVASLRSSARNRLSHGLAAALTWSLADEDADWAACYALLADTKRRRGAVMKISLDYLLALRVIFGPRITMHRLADADGLLAAALVYRLTPEWDCLIAWGDRTEYRRLPLMNVMAYRLVCASIADRVSLLDLGISSVDGVPDEGLIRFKRSIGAIIGLRTDFRVVLR